MRVLVDHSGYDLRNLGDAAMLQVCVSRLQAALPDAEVGVITSDPARLEQCCPGSRPVRSAVGESRPLTRLSPSLPLALEQVWKATGPVLVRRPGAPGVARPSILRAIRSADLVVAAGGGYLTDTWWWHATGVLSVLAAAQRLGRPTAMFGQGLGPLTHRLVRRQAAAVLPRLQVLGLREGLRGLPLARELGVAADRVIVTGDDALGLAVQRPAVQPVTTDAGTGRQRLGVNVRFARYTNLDRAALSGLGSVLHDIAVEHDLTLTALPVSPHATSNDLEGIRQLLQAVPAERLVLDELSSPTDLAAAASRCRAVVTGSYHAAVFALAAGVPVVGLTSSPYYDAKFEGLANLFPGAMTVLPVDGSTSGARMHAAIAEALSAPAEIRRAARDVANEQVRRSQDLYDRFLAESTVRQGARASA